MAEGVDTDGLWRRIAEEHAEVIRELLMFTTGGSRARDRAAAALRRHREALDA